MRWMRGALVTMSLAGCGGGGAGDLAEFVQSCEDGEAGALRLGEAPARCGTAEGTYVNGLVHLEIVLPRGTGPTSTGFSFEFEVEGPGTFEVDAMSVRDGRDIGGGMSPSAHLRGDLVETADGVVLTATVTGTTYFRDRADIAQASQDFAGAVDGVVLSVAPPSTSLAPCRVPRAPTEANAAVLFDGASAAYCTLLEPRWVGDALSVEGDFFFGPALGYTGILVSATADRSESRPSLAATITVDGEHGTCQGTGTWMLNNLVRPPSGSGTGQLDTSRLDGELEAPCSISFEVGIEQMTVDYVAD